MARPPAEGRSSQAAERAELPVAVRNALRFIYAGAVFAVVFGVTMGLTTHSRSVHVGNPSSGAYKAGYVVGGAIIGLVLGGLWLWMAWANKRGRSWARIVSTVFFGVLTLYAFVGLFALPAAPETALILEWAAGLAAVVSLWRGQSSDYYKAMSGPTGYPPLS